MVPGLARSMGKDNEFEYNFRKYKIHNLLQH